MERTVRISFILLLVWGQLSPSFGAQPIGSVSALRGEVLDRRQEATQWVMLKLVDPLYLYDTVKTGEASRVEFLLEDDSLLSLGENSQLLIDEHIYQPKQERRISVFSLISGKVRAIIGKSFRGEGSRFQIETPTAVISARGTDFITWVVSRQLTIVIVLAGEVRVRNILAKIVGEQLVRANFMTEIRRDRPPSIPVIAPPEQKIHLIKDTRVPKGLSVLPPAEEVLGQEIKRRGREIAKGSPAAITAEQPLPVKRPAGLPAVPRGLMRQGPVGLGLLGVRPPDLPPIPQQPIDNPAAEQLLRPLPPPPPPPGG